MHQISTKDIVVRTRPNGQRIVQAQSADINLCLQVYRDQGADCLGINDAWGFDTSASLGFLRSAEFVKGLDVVDTDGRDLSVISSMPWLESLRVGSSGKPLDLSTLSHLVDINIGWSTGLKWPSLMVRVERLHLNKVVSKDRSLRILPPIPNLKCLGITQGNLESMDGIDRYPALSELDIAYLPKLRSVCSVTILNCLECLAIEACPNVDDVSCIRSIASLRSVRLSRIATLESIGFVRGMPNLKSFTFVGTDVRDGDMRPLIGLDYVAFTDKRHFSDKLSRIRDLIRQRTS